MKHKLLVLGIIALAIVTFGTIPAEAQTVANGPYYAAPSWDQTLPSSTRFIVLSNMGSNAVLDRETGLVWERSPSTTEVSWYQAQMYCNSLTLGNRKGWKLPTLQELQSLVDPSVPSPGPTLPTGHPFQNVQAVFDGYWSATTNDIEIPGFGHVAAWFVSFKDGTIASEPKHNISDHYGWCVRGGQGVDRQ
jgi:hypothetical protein